MQSSARQQELERLYNARRGHVPQISITDDDYHVTEALGSYYGDGDTASSHSDPAAEKRPPRPLSFVPSSVDSIENQHQAPLQTRRSRRNGSYFESQRDSPPRVSVVATLSPVNFPSPDSDAHTPKIQRIGSLASEHGAAADGPFAQTSPVSSLSRQSSTDTAIQPFPLNDIDYESSPAAVAQELSNLQAIRRMSMNVDAADPDLPAFGAGLVPTVAPRRSEDENDAARLFWVPAHLHPELAPKEFKTFIEDRVDKIRRRSGDADSLLPDDLDRSGSGSGLRRKKSMLSHQIDTRGAYEDGAERLERKRSSGMSLEAQARVDLAELESLVGDPAQLMRRMSLDTARHSLDTGVGIPMNEDMPILPPLGQSLKRSTRTAYRKGSLKKGERVPFGKRMQQRRADAEAEAEAEEPSSPRDSLQAPEEVGLGLTRVQTEPGPQRASNARDEFPPRQSSIPTRLVEYEGRTVGDEPVQRGAATDEWAQRPQPAVAAPLERPPQSRPQPRQFQSRLAAGHGRTSAQLPGYNNANPLPNVVETLPDGTKIPAGNLAQQISERRASIDGPERRRSNEMQRGYPRTTPHLRPMPMREPRRSATLDDLTSNPSLIPGSGGMGTDSLTFLPTFEDHKFEKKDAPRKSSWKRVFGGDDDEKKAAKEEKNADASSLRSTLKSSRSNKPPAEKARLDVLQNSIDGNVPSRGRESIVLNRNDIRLDEERKKESKKSSETRKDSSGSGREAGLLSTIFGGKKKSGIDGGETARERKRASKMERNAALSSSTSLDDPVLHLLKPDIDYNWTRFSILEERAIYRMAHIKLANPRRALHSQVLLSNFMYSYLAKVQLMHPQVQIPAVHQRGQQGRQRQDEQQQPAEFSQYQRWQQQQDREEAAAAAGPANSANDPRSSFDSRSSGEFEDDSQQLPAGASTGGYDARTGSEDYQYNGQPQPRQQQQQQQQRNNPSHTYYSTSASAGSQSHRSTNGSTRSGYSVAGTHDYLGYPKDGRPFESHGGLWDEDEDADSLGSNDGSMRAAEALW